MLTAPAAMFNIPLEKQIEIARQVLPDLEHLGNGMCQATCPGVDCHSTANSPRDYRIWFSEEKGPHDNCMHASCAAARDAAMRQIYTLLRAADPAHRAAVRTYGEQRAAYVQAPKLRPAPFELYNPDDANRVADMCPFVVTEEWLRQHSPVPIPREPEKWPRLLLESIYQPGDKILVFTKYKSQGQILHQVGGSTVRLEKRPPAYGYTYPARPRTGWPRGGEGGVWFLTAPVTGEWMPNENARDRDGNIPMGRRHAACVTRYPYLVLESDEAPPAVWLNILVQLADRIVAVYTSGGKSYHALVRVAARTKEEFDLHRIRYCTRLTALGADHGAVTAVRLTRLPGCFRFGRGEGENHRPYLDEHGKPAPRMQELLYLNPAADGRPILELTQNR